LAVGAYLSRAKGCTSGAECCSSGAENHSSAKSRFRLRSTNILWYFN